jgi:hypothetical protein
MVALGYYAVSSTSRCGTYTRQAQSNFALGANKFHHAQLKPNYLMGNDTARAGPNKLDLVLELPLAVRMMLMPYGV